MAGEEQFCCEAVRRRHIRNIPSLALAKDPDTVAGSKSIKRESTEERVERISQTRVPLCQFWFHCLDWEMLRLFATLFILFFITVAIASILYLFLIYCFNAKLWQYYYNFYSFSDNRRGEL